MYIKRHTSLIKTLGCIHTLACLAGELSSSIVPSSNITVLHCDPKQSAQWQQNVQSFSQTESAQRGTNLVHLDSNAAFLTSMQVT